MQNTSQRIELNDTTLSATIKLAEGNPGACTVCASILKEGEVIDPDGVFGGLGILLMLDTFGIYGSRIWMLHKDVCGQDLVNTLAVLRACQLGYISGKELNHAIDNYGEGIDVGDLLRQVKDFLPNFGISYA